MNIGAALTRKIGPLPAWGWGVAVGGALLGVKLLRGNSDDGGASGLKVVSVPTSAGGFSGGGIGAGNEFASQLGTELDKLRDDVANADEEQREDFEDRLEDILDSVNERFDDLADMVGTIQPIPDVGEKPGPKRPPATVTPLPKVTPTTPSGPLTLAQARAALAAIGAPTSWATSPFAKSHSYVFASTKAIQDWAKRYARDPKSGYREVNGKLVPR